MQKSPFDLTPAELAEIAQDPSRMKELVEQANAEMVQKNNDRQAEAAIVQNKANKALEAQQGTDRNVADLQQHIEAQGYNVTHRGNGLTLNMAEMNPLTGRPYGTLADPSIEAG